MNPKKSQTILVLCAHPDDETLGLGGTLALHAEKGDKVHVMIFADGQFGRDSSDKGILKRKIVKINFLINIEFFYVVKGCTKWFDIFSDVFGIVIPRQPICPKLPCRFKKVRNTAMTFTGS